MAIGCVSLESGTSPSFPHGFHGGSAAELLKRPRSILRCPFMKAFLGLKATFLPPPAPVNETSVKNAPDLFAMASDLVEHGRAAGGESSFRNFHDAQVDASSKLAMASDLVEHRQAAGEESTFEDFQDAQVDASSKRATEMSNFLADSVLLQERYANRRRTLMVLGLNVHSSAVEMREKLAIPEADWAHAVEELTAYPHIEEAGILSTCNRFEVYVSALSWNMAIVEVSEWMSRKSGISLPLLRKHLSVLRNEDASTHLLRVASGLDSLVLGEGQILSQVKHVVQMGQGVEGFGRQLTGLFKQAVIAGKRVRSETSIGKGSVSVSSAAVELVAKKLPKNALEEASVCVVGAGKMAKLLLKHLMAKGCTSIVLLNRSKERVTELQRMFPHVKLTYHPLCDLGKCVEDAHLVFTCTASDAPLIDKQLVETGLRAAGKKYFVDISVPRNVSPCVTELSGAVVLDVDDLQEVIAGNKEERYKRSIETHTIIEEERRSFEAWQDSLEVVPTIKKLRAYAESIRISELERCLGKMGDDLSVKDKRLVEELSRTIVNKLLHGPMVHLRSDGSSSSCRAEILENMHALERMFNLNS